MDLKVTSNRLELSAGCVNSRLLLVLGSGIVVAAAVGCNRFGKSPSKPSLSPEQSATQAMEEYDSDSDGMISSEEAEASPGLSTAFAKIDANKDEQLSEQEIVNRINYYKNSTSWVINGQIRVFYRGRPLEGATVTFQPEPFLGESFKVCSGITDQRGEAFVKGDEALPGIYLGFYRVKINKEVKGKELLPAKYNEETELGFEANNDPPDAKEMQNFNIFKLK